MQTSFEPEGSEDFSFIDRSCMRACTPQKGQPFQPFRIEAVTVTTTERSQSMKFKIFVFLALLSTCSAALADPVSLLAYGLSLIPELAAYSQAILIAGPALGAAFIVRRRKGGAS